MLAQTNAMGAREAAVLAAIWDAGMLSLGEMEPRFPEVGRRSLQRDLRVLLDKGMSQSA